MREITPETAADYLVEAGRVAAGSEVRAQALGWGVSNVVIRVDVPGQPTWILKQARERLRVKQLWVSRLERIWTERAALELLDTLLPEGAVPRVLFSDEPNFLFAMSCAPDDSVVWKEQLLAGQVDRKVAVLAGVYLGLIHRKTLNHPALAGRLADTTVFDELRVDPFYRTVAKVHPDLSAPLDRLVRSAAEVPAAERCLVLADFSPKNMLVHSEGLTLVDFETAHAGDPAYDLGFFLSHLLLKAWNAQRRGLGGGAEPYLGLVQTFLDAYRHQAAFDVGEPRGDRGTSPLDERSALHAAGCALARVDGKSPVDYLDEPCRVSVRRFAREALAKPAQGLAELVERARGVIGLLEPLPGS